MGDHLALHGVYTQWAETNFSAQFCYENFVQVGGTALPPLLLRLALLASSGLRCSMGSGG